MEVHEIVTAALQVILGLLQAIYWYLEALYRKIVPPPMKSIDGETILVTGATGGIGKEICRYLVKCGTNLKLILWDLHQTDLEKFAGELRVLGGASLKVFPMATDISSREKIEIACQKIKDTTGAANIIINNAGIAPQGNFLQLTNQEIEKTIQINLMSHLWIIRKFLPEMLSLNHGRIVNICSMGGLKATSHALPYFASKFGVNGYTESLKVELRMPQYNYDGIKLTTVYPYFVQTPMIKSLGFKEEEQGKMPITFQKFLSAEEVAKRIVDGMRREYEYIYCPPTIPILLVFLDYLIPLKLSRAIQAKYMDKVAFKDPMEQQRFMAPLLAPSNSANGRARNRL